MPAGPDAQSPPATALRTILSHSGQWGAHETREMNEATEKLKATLRGLAPHERAELAHFLIHSLDEETDSDAETAWETELNARTAEIVHGTTVGEPAATMFAELRAKYT